jgi:hypothetical protein
MIRRNSMEFDFKRVLANCKEVAKLLDLPEEEAIKTALKAFKKETGIDFIPLLAARSNFEEPETDVAIKIEPTKKPSDKIDVDWQKVAQNVKMSKEYTKTNPKHGKFGWEFPKKKAYDELTDDDFVMPSILARKLGIKCYKPNAMLESLGYQIAHSKGYYYPSKKAKKWEDYVVYVADCGKLTGRPLWRIGFFKRVYSEYLNVLRGPDSNKAIANNIRHAQKQVDSASHKSSDYPKPFMAYDSLAEHFKIVPSMPMIILTHYGYIEKGTLGYHPTQKAVFEIHYLVVKAKDALLWQPTFFGSLLDSYNRDVRNVIKPVQKITNIPQKIIATKGCDNTFYLPTQIAKIMGLAPNEPNKVLAAMGYVVRYAKYSVTWRPTPKARQKEDYIFGMSQNGIVRRDTVLWLLGFFKKVYKEYKDKINA